MQFLVDTSAFYAREAARWVEEDGLPDYLIKAEDRLNRERERVTNYLHSSSEKKLISARLPHLPPTRTRAVRHACRG